MTRAASVYTEPREHRHADGTAHAHGGSDDRDLNAFLRSVGQIKAGDTRPGGTYGDDPHTHGTLDLIAVETGERGADSGPVVWTERSASTASDADSLYAGENTGDDEQIERTPEDRARFSADMAAIRDRARPVFDCGWCGSLAVTEDDTCPSASVPRYAGHTPDQGADGTAHLAYFDRRTQRSYIWNGRAAFVQVSVGGYGEPATEAIPAPIFSGRVDKQVDPRDFLMVCAADAASRRAYGEYEPYE